MSKHYFGDAGVVDWNQRLDEYMAKVSVVFSRTQVLQGTPVVILAEPVHMTKLLFLEGIFGLA